MTVDADTIRDEDVSNGFDDDADGVGAAANAFLADLIGEDKPSTEKTEGATENPEHETDEGGSEENEESNTEDTETQEEDDPEYEVKFGEETKKFKLSYLKKLAGQEGALTQKSQKVAEAQRIAEAMHTHADVALRAMHERAVARYKTYASWGPAEWAQLANDMTPEDYAGVRQEAAAAKADLDFITTELGNHVQAQQQQAVAAQRVAAAECIKTLSDPATGIEGFGQPLYTEMMQFCSANGVPEAYNLTSPAALKLVHMAMMYAKGQKTAKSVQEKVAKVVNTPQRVLKPSKGQKPTTSASVQRQEAVRKLRASGSVEDAADVFYRDLIGDSDD